MSTDFDLDKNRYLEIEGIAKDEDGNVMPIGDPVKLVFRMAHKYDPDTYLEKTTDDSSEIEKADAPNGEYTIFFRPEDTETLPAGEYRYEVVYIDNPASPEQVYLLNPTSSESGLVRLKDNLVEV